MAHTVPADALDGPERTGPQPARSSRWFRVHGLLPLSLPPLLVAAGLACYGAATASRDIPVGMQTLLWVLTTMAIALSVAGIAMGWYSNRWRIAALLCQLEQLTETGKTELIGPSEDGELASLIAALNLYIAQLRNRAARLQLQKKELDIQTRITEAEKRCVQTIVEKIPLAVILTDAFDEVVLVNRSAQEIFGYTLGATYRQPIHRALRNHAMVQLIKSMRKPDEPAQRNVRVRLNSETAQPQTLRASLTRVTDPRGHVHGVVTVLRPEQEAAVARPHQAHATQ